MKTLHFSISIEAPRERVWDWMLGPDTYRVWTSAFLDGSYYDGSWAKGEKIRFLSPAGEGLTSVIDENRAYEFVSIRHLGHIKNGVEDIDSASVRTWAPSYENYTLMSNGRRTDVLIDLDVTAKFERFMLDTWPRALAALKSLCEAQVRA